MARNSRSHLDSSNSLTPRGLEKIQSLLSPPSLLKNGSNKHNRALAVGFDHSKDSFHANSNSMFDRSLDAPPEPKEESKFVRKMTLKSIKDTDIYDKFNTSMTSAEMNTTFQSAFTNPLTIRLATALRKHLETSASWNKTINSLKKQRTKVDMDTSPAKKKLNLRVSQSIGPLVERQQTFRYDDDGVKVPSFYWEKKAAKREPSPKADLQSRVNAFFQTCRDSDVAFIPFQTKNPRTMIYSTSPTRRIHRGASLKKDITRQQKSPKRSKVFQGYVAQKDRNPSNVFFNAKSPSPRDRAVFVPELSFAQAR